ncbi:hypothetical protein AB0K09_29175 [Streptomyces sp. NPDC049577]|uniref:hypothetical protein n=1 Tax=Streptomyces sp. NPDC049577 TaxID=3155153 RepID=UPI003423A697
MPRLASAALGVAAFAAALVALGPVAPALAEPSVPPRTPHTLPAYSHDDDKPGGEKPGDDQGQPGDEGAGAPDLPALPDLSELLPGLPDLQLPGL